jgi:SNF2 family DNA or RNA helicase
VYSTYKVSRDNMDGKKPDFKPFLIMVPPNLIEQWAEEIQMIMINLDVYIYYGNIHKQIGNNVGVLKEKLIPRHYLFSKDNPKNARAVILTSYQTLNVRHGPMAVKEFCLKKKLPYNAANPMIPSLWSFSLKGYFNIVVFDKAHILRNHASTISYSV